MAGVSNSTCALGWIHIHVGWIWHGAVAAAAATVGVVMQMAAGQKGTCHGGGIQAAVGLAAAR